MQRQRCYPTLLTTEIRQMAQLLLFRAEIDQWIDEQRGHEGCRGEPRAAIAHRLQHQRIRQRRPRCSTPAIGLGNREPNQPKRPGRIEDIGRRGVRLVGFASTRRQFIGREAGQHVADLALFLA